MQADAEFNTSPCQTPADIRSAAIFEQASPKSHRLLLLQMKKAQLSRWMTRLSELKMSGILCRINYSKLAIRVICNFKRKIQESYLILLMVLEHTEILERVRGKIYLFTQRGVHYNSKKKKKSSTTYQQILLQRWLADQNDTK